MAETAGVGIGGPLSGGMFGREGRVGGGYGQEINYPSLPPLHFRPIVKGEGIQGGAFLGSETTNTNYYNGCTHACTTTQNMDEAARNIS